MKKLTVILSIFIFASPSSAAVYKWVDDRAVVNFVNDYNKIPPAYRDKFEKLSGTEIERPTSSISPSHRNRGYTVFS